MCFTCGKTALPLKHALLRAVASRDLQLWLLCPVVWHKYESPASSVVCCLILRFVAVFLWFRAFSVGIATTQLWFAAFTVSTATMQLWFPALQAMILHFCCGLQHCKAMMLHFGCGLQHWNLKCCISLVCDTVGVTVEVLLWFATA